MGVLLLSSGLLLFELCLTRVLSVLFYYHTAFLAISVAMLGLAAGGLWVHLKPGLLRGRTGGAVLLTALATALLPPLFPLIHLDLEQLDALTGAPFLAALGIAVLASLLPFLGGGAVLAHVFKNHHGHVGRLYAADLCGAAAGTLLLVPAMEWLGGPGALFACGVLIALAALSFPPRRRARVLLILFLLCGLTLAQVTLDLFPVNVDIERGAGSGREPTILAKRWNAFSRVVALEGQGWDRGLSDLRLEGLEGRIAPQIEALIDINAFAPMVRFDGDLQHVSYLREVVSNLGLHLLPRGARVAVIGPGCGKDVLGALLFEPRRITGIEINPILVNDFVRGRFREFAGDIYDRPDVRIIVGEGRAELSRLDDTFDIIIANSVVTWAANSSGAMNLSEQTLFTREAFRIYRDHLGPDGILSISLWDDDDHAVLQRLLETWRAAEEGDMIPPLATRVAAAGNRWLEEGLFSTLLISRRPFSGRQRRLFAALCERFGFEPLFIPGSEEAAVPALRAYLADPTACVAGSPYDISAATDDRPFFFYTLRPGAALRFWETDTRSENAAYSSLVVSLGVVGLLCLLAIGGPLWWTRRRSGQGDGSGRPPLGSLERVHFMALGLGFMLVEIALIQRFSLTLGHPTHALTVVLFGILLWSGLGSRWAGGWKEGVESRMRLRRVMSALVMLLAVLWSSLPRLQAAVAPLDTPLRIVLVFLLLAPLGFLMGVPMPVGLRVVGARRPSGVPWAFGLNGAAGVTASVLAVLLAVLFGFTVAFATGVAAYILALLTRPRPSAPGPRTG